MRLALCRIQPSALALLLTALLVTSSSWAGAQHRADAPIHCGVDILLEEDVVPIPEGGLKMRQAPAGKRTATITLNAGANLQANAQALATWQQAVDIWEALLDDTVTVVINADLQPLNPGVLGSASSRVFVGDNYAEIRDAMVADAAADEAIVTQLPTEAQFSMSVPPGFGTDNRIRATKANLRALGFDMSFDDPNADATITFSSNFAFDFDPSDGITPGTFDFEAICVHELGHALGFTSRVDRSDFFRSQGQTDTAAPNALDMFRFAPGDGAADFTNNPRMQLTGDLAATQVVYDGSQDLGMSTGVGLGDGRQASHFKADELTGTYIGIMDPTISPGTRQVLTVNDIRMFGLIGWDITDCNDNAIGDATDIAMGTSQDINSNGIPDECEDINDIAVSTGVSGRVSIYNVPDGSGTPFTQALQWDGVAGSSPATVDATIDIAVTLGGSPVPGATVLLETTLGGLVHCPGAGIVGTNASGMASYSTPLFAGGFTTDPERTIINPGFVGGNVTYTAAGSPVADLDIHFNSADISGDNVVNLSDVGPFSADLAGPYNYRSDFFWDGTINLSDVGPFSAAIGATCLIPAKDLPQVAKGEFADRIGIYFDRSARTRSIDLKAGDIAEAYVVIDGPAASHGIAAWEARLESTPNVEVLDWTLTDDAFNFRKAPDFVVGMGGSRSDANGLQVATLRFRVTDDRPAALSVRPSSVGSLGPEVPVVSTGGDYELHPMEVRGGSSDDVAWINDPSADVRQIASKGVALRNSPNPFNPATEIQFNLPSQGRVEVRIFDLAGRLVRRLGGTVLEAGPQALRWDGTDDRGRGVGSGQYFYRLNVDGQNIGSTSRMSLIK